MGDTATMDILAMPTPMPTTDTTARGLLMLRPLPPLRPMLMLTMVSTDIDTVMALPTMAITARGLLMPLPLLMLTMVLMAMDITTATDTPTTVMPTMDTTDIPTPTDTTDIINLLIFVKN